MKHFKNGTHQSTLCWKCRHIVPDPVKKIGCSWSVGCKPVEGWTARATKVCGGSYCVLECPQFERG